VKEEWGRIAPKDQEFILAFRKKNLVQLGCGTEVPPVGHGGQKKKRSAGEKNSRPELEEKTGAEGKKKRGGGGGKAKNSSVEREMQKDNEILRERLFGPKNSGQEGGKLEGGRGKDEKDGRKEGIIVTAIDKAEATRRTIQNVSINQHDNQGGS